MKLKKIKAIGENRFIQAIQQQSNVSDIIDEMMKADSDDRLLYLAKKLVAREDVRKDMANNVIEEIYGQRQHTDNDNS